MLKEGMSLKETADEIASVKGNVKGDAINLHAAYVRKMEGDDGLRKVEEKLKELGYPLEFAKVNKFEWYPIYLADLVILVSKEVFNWSDEDIFRMGKESVKHSFIFRLLLSHTLSVEKLFKSTSYMWKRYFDYGDIEPVKMEEDHILVRMKEYKVHPLVCQHYYPGYFLTLVKICLPDKKITIKETKCFFKGDPYHEYKIEWS